MNSKPRRSGRHRLKLITAGVIATAGAAAAVIIPGAIGAPGPAGAGFQITVMDTKFLLHNIQIAQTHAAQPSGNPACAAPNLTVANCATPGTTPIGVGPNSIADPLLTNGIRQIDGENNNLDSGFAPWNGAAYGPTVNVVAGQPDKSKWGSADQYFPITTGQIWRNVVAADSTFSPGPGPPVPLPGGGALTNGTTYFNRTQSVRDDAPRVISNLISDQASTNPAAVTASGGGGALVDGSLPVTNKPPAAGAAAPYNENFALFGQFFDHGLDLVGKTSAQYVQIKLKPTDGLYCAVGTNNGAHVTGSPLTGVYGVDCSDMFLMNRTVTRPAATAGQLESKNTTTPWVDQNQTYTSDPSHNVFSREYVCLGAPALATCTNTNPPVATGKILSSSNAATAGSLANWAETKLQAQQKLGINLDDYDVNNVPVVLANEYGDFIAGPHGFPMLVQANGTDLSEGNNGGGVAGTMANTVNLTTGPGPIDLVSRVGHAFIDDMAQGAAPRYAANCAPCTNLGNSALLGTHFIAGDGRGNENIGLTAIHTIFHDEHDRLVTDLENVITSSGDNAYIAQWHVGNNLGADWDGNKIFAAARTITSGEYQHLVFGEFARLVEPGIAAFGGYDPTIKPDITSEFANAVYRFGHSLLTPFIHRKAVPNGADMSISLLDGFTNPCKFNDTGVTKACNGATMTGTDAAGAVINGGATQPGSEVDEFVINTLRNTLLGQPLDLPALNLARGRDTGVQTLNGARTVLFQQTGDPGLKPYATWSEFRAGLRNQGSFVNFVAAYYTGDAQLNTLRTNTDTCTPAGATCGFAAMRTRATTVAASNAMNSGGNGLDSIDLWIGGLAESSVNAPGGSLLGPTFSNIFRVQLESLQNPDRFYYLGYFAGTNLANQLEGNTFSEMVIRNTGANNMPLNAFLMPTKIVDMSFATPTTAGAVTPSGGVTVSNTPVAGTWTYAGGLLDSVFIGTAGNDSMIGGNGSDTMRGNDGNDTVNGSTGNDTLYGGLGDDNITDTGGTNIMAGGDGNDNFSSAGADQQIGGFGNDFHTGAGQPLAVLAGVGNDLVLGGTADDGLGGDDNSDWIEGGTGIDTINGDAAAPFSIDLMASGDDVLTGNVGGDLLNGDGGTDVMTSITSTEGDSYAGGFGFDFTTYGDATTPVDADLGLGAAPAGVLRNPDTFLDVEGLSGGSANDTLQGDNRSTLASGTPGGDDYLLNADIAKYRGLSSMVPASLGANAITDGNIIMGGAGNDTITGHGGNDIINGDASLIARMSVPNVAAAGTCPGVTGTKPADPAIAGNVLISSLNQIRGAIQARCLSVNSVVYVRTVDPGTPGGTDTAVFSGPKADYTITASGAGWTVTDARNGSPDGTDTLTGIEQLQFSDGTVAPAPQAARAQPTPPAPGQPAAGQPASAGSPAQQAAAVVTQKALEASHVKRVGRKFIITVNADTNNGSVTWKATLKNPISKKSITTSGTIRKGSSSQTKSVTVPKDWVAKKRVTTVTLTTGSASAPFRVQ